MAIVSRESGGSSEAEQTPATTGVGRSTASHDCGGKCRKCHCWKRNRPDWLAPPCLAWPKGALAFFMNSSISSSSCYTTLPCLNKPSRSFIHIAPAKASSPNHYKEHIRHNGQGRVQRWYVSFWSRALGLAGCRRRGRARTVWRSWCDDCHSCRPLTVCVAPIRRFSTPRTPARGRLTLVASVVQD